MSAHSNGGPAFPVSTADVVDGHQDGHATWQFPGMTLRDYFAAHAPIGVADANDIFYQANARHARLGETLEFLAALRMRYAEAMIKERAK